RQAVAFIHQDLGLIDWMTVSENIALGVGYRRRAGLIDWSRSRARAGEVLDILRGGDVRRIDPDSRIMHLSRTERSLVAIGRALAAEAEILVLDEPTASLPADEVDRLLSVLRDLRGRGIGMIYVSHRLDEVFRVADRVAVLRDGRLVGAEPIAATNPAHLVEMIVGRPPDTLAEAPVPPRPEPCLVLDRLVSGNTGPVSLELRRGEITALVGLRGAGQDSIGRALFGCRPIDGGVATLASRPFHPRSPAEAMAAGIGLVAGDRLGESLAPRLSIRENLFLNPGAHGHGPLALRSPARERADSIRAGARMVLRPNEPARPVETLSGGNQQKVVLARWLLVARHLLILEEPTAGVDVGAKSEIYALLRRATAVDGLAILVVATDFEEVSILCHRALVFSQDRVVAELDRAELSVNALLRAASAGEPSPPPSAAAPAAGVPA
ncbi:MAG: sugar ABC transporter ATP-binding protein, partial [Gluconacetobacter diazotrophicus]|nr:sugar ABC transporter ATP-binding protein [Gluconacetobacter diazotrophicus]